MREVDKLLHDLNNKLTGIIGFADLILEDWKEDGSDCKFHDEHKDNLKHIIDAGIEAYRLIEAYRNKSRVNK